MTKGASAIFKPGGGDHPQKEVEKGGNFWGNA